MFRQLFIILIIFLASVTIAQGSGEKIRYMIEENPPYNFIQDGRIQGIAVDILLKLSEENGQAMQASEIEMVPWPRGYKIVQHTPHTALFTMARTEQREDLFKWVGPIYELTIGLVASKKNNITVNSFNDLKTLRIGTIREGAPEQLLIQAGYPTDKLERVTKPEQNINKLTIGRIDLLAFNTDSTRYTMQKMGLNPNDYETVFILKKVHLYYAFNKETDDATIQWLNNGLNQLRKEDSDGNSPYKKILSLYLDQR